MSDIKDAIYLFENIITGRRYIGKTSKPDIELLEDILKYGIRSFLLIKVINIKEE